MNFAWFVKVVPNIVRPAPFLRGRHQISCPILFITIRASENGVWVGVRNGLLRLDPDSLTPVASFMKLTGYQDLFVTDDAIWVRQDTGFLYRIDPNSNQFFEQVVSEQRFYNMCGLTVTDDSVWTSAGDDDLVLRLSLK